MSCTPCYLLPSVPTPGARFRVPGPAGLQPKSTVLWFLSHRRAAGIWHVCSSGKRTYSASVRTKFRIHQGWVCECVVMCVCGGVCMLRSLFLSLTVRLGPAEHCTRCQLLVEQIQRRNTYCRWSSTRRKVCLTNCLFLLVLTSVAPYVCAYVRTCVINCFLLCLPV